MAQSTTFIGELTAAARGVLGLIIGDRRVPQYFDLSLRGLYGSFIAILAIVGFEALLPYAMGATGTRGSIFSAVVTIAIAFAFSVGAAALALRQMKRLDGLIPFVIVLNWTNFFVGVVTSAVILAGLPSNTILFAGVIVGLVIQINIARLIVTLSPLQIAMFLVAQFVGVLIGLLIVATLFPISPEELEAIAAANNLPA